MVLSMTSDTPRPTGETVILGIGNTLLTDEGVGVHVARRLQDLLGERPGLQILDGGTLSFTLLTILQRCEHLIAIDAAELGRAPGEFRCLTDTALDRYLRSGRRSVHEVGLADLLDMARLSGQLPTHRTLIGIQPASTAWGERPTATVAAAIPGIVSSVLELLSSERHTSLCPTIPTADKIRADGAL